MITGLKDLTVNMLNCPFGPLKLLVLRNPVGGAPVQLHVQIVGFEPSSDGL